MPNLTINSVKYFFEDTKNFSENGTIVFSHGLLWSGEMFHKQVEALKNSHRIITFDFRGQGKTEATEGGYDMETLYEDAAMLIKKLVGEPVIFAGLSMGGFIGMRLAARRPDLIKKLILMETSCEPEPVENVGKYKMLNNVVKYIGFFPVVSKVMQIMFSQTFLNDKNRVEEKKYWIAQLKKNNRKSITKAVMGVIERKGVEGELKNIKCPTLIIVGDEDVATIPAKSQKIHSLIGGSKLVMISHAGHTSSIEEPEQVNLAIRAFLI